MNLEDKITAARTAAAKQTMIDHCRANPTVAFETLIDKMESDLVSVFMSLTPADLGVKAPTQRKTKNKGKTTPAVGQATVTSEVMRWANNSDPGDACSMQDLREMSGGTAAQVKKALEDIDTVKLVGKGRGAKYVAQPEAA